ncbi:MAG: hypothetical protein Q4B67_00300 [Eubacteriales bacterium]|nr:hypothetical protein [Eubacteriales bacterium]
MRLIIRKKTDNELENSLITPTTTKTEFKTFLTSVLKQASSEEKESLFLGGLKCHNKPSDDFLNMSIMEQIIVDFLRNNEFPKKVHIICDSSESVRRHKQVYNYRFAETKSDIMHEN